MFVYNAPVITCYIFLSSYIMGNTPLYIYTHTYTRARTHARVCVCVCMYIKSHLYNKNLSVFYLYCSRCTMLWSRSDNSAKLCMHFCFTAVSDDLYMVRDVLQWEELKSVLQKLRIYLTPSIIRERF